MYFEKNIINLIYQFDNTYKNIFDTILKDLFIIYVDLNGDTYSCPKCKFPDKSYLYSHKIKDNDTYIFS